MEKIHNSEIIGSAKIIEIVDNRIFKAALPNGKIIHAHFAESELLESKIEVGDTVRVKMNPFDFSRGHIVRDWFLYFFLNYKIYGYNEK